MNTKRFAILFLLVLHSIAVSANTAYMGGNKFYEFLKESRIPSSTNFVNNGIVLGYLQGIVDATNGIRNTSTGTMFCVPKGVTGNQLVDISYIFFEQNPQLRHYSADSLIAAALQKSFPCK